MVSNRGPYNEGMKEEKAGSKTPSSTQKPRNCANYSELRDFSNKTGTKPGRTEVVPFSLHADLYDILQDVCKEKKIMYIVPRPHVDFKPPKLHDTGDCWYVYYSVKSPETGKFKRYRVKVNRGTIREKKAAAREIMASLSQKLQLGWNPVAGGQGNKGAVPAFEVFQAFVEKYPNIRCIARHVRYAHSGSENSLMAYMWFKGHTFESRMFTFNILDRVGGGDAFASGLIYAYMHHFKPMDMVNFAVASSVIKHTIHGDGNITDDVDSIINLMNMNYDIKR